MPEARWTNQSHPQTLQIAVFLLYANAFFFVLDVLRTRGLFMAYARFFPWGQLLIASAVLSVFAGRGIASGRKWGYQLGVAMAFLPFVFRVLYTGSLNAVLSGDLITLMFEVALVALLLHEQSRQYQRVWFK